jgi:hypothetical protein
MAQNKRVQHGPFAGLTQGAADLVAAAERYGDEWGGNLGRQVQEAAKQATQAYQRGLELEGQNALAARPANLLQNSVAQAGIDRQRSQKLGPQGGGQAYLVGRAIPQAPNAQHQFVVITDQDGKVVRSCNYGPSNNIFDPSDRLVGLSDPRLGNPTAQQDDAAWRGRSGVFNSRHTIVRPIPASPAAVAAQCDAMDARLGTLLSPGTTPYDLTGLWGPNSNSAASTIVNKSIQSERPGAPVFGPAGLAPGWRYPMSGR